jgi:hypothetical protein
MKFRFLYFCSKFNSMKRYIFLLLVALLSMCAPEKSRFDILEEKQAEQLKTGIRTDTIFMDFTYGMSQRLTFESFQKYVNDSVFLIKKGGVFEYNMPLDSVIVRVAFHTKFYHDSLYRFSLILKGKNEVEAGKLQQKMVNLLKMNNGTPLEFPSTSDKTKSDYYFISGNQQIELKYPKATGRMIVTYSDFTLENRKNRESPPKKGSQDLETPEQ